MIVLFHPGVASLTHAQPHIIGEIDHEKSSLAILLSSAESRSVLSMCMKYWLIALSSFPSKKVWCTFFASLKAVFRVRDMYKPVCSDTESRVLTGISFVAGYDMILSNKGITTAPNSVAEQAVHASSRENLSSG